MKRYTVYFLVLTVLLFVLGSCATTVETAVVEPVAEVVVEEPATETPAESVVAEPVAAEAVVEEVVETPAEPVAVEPVAKVVVEEEPEPIEIWKALNLDLTQNGKPVYLPEEYLNYSVFVGIFENEYAELVVLGTDFKIAAIYEFTESGLVVSPVYYENVPDELRDVFLSLDVKLPVDYYFTGELLEDGTAVMEAEALEYKLSVAWAQVM